MLSPLVLVSGSDCHGVTTDNSGHQQQHQHQTDNSGQHQQQHQTDSIGQPSNNCSCPGGLVWWDGDCVRGEAGTNPRRLSSEGEITADIAIPNLNWGGSELIK